MRNLVRAFALSLAALSVAPAMHAATPPAGTLTCYPGNGNGMADLTLNLNSFFFAFGDAPSNSNDAGYFAVYTDAADFPGIAAELEGPAFTYDHCTFSASPNITPGDVTMESLAVNVGMGGTYTQVTFSYLDYRIVTYYSASSSPDIKMPKRAPQTPEEKAKSLAAFLARVPSPAATQK